MPSTFELSQNYPNPFNSTTTIHYALPRRDEGGLGNQSVQATLKIYNLLGQEVLTLIDKEQEPGYYTIHWDGRDEHGREVASGIYFYRLSIGKSPWQECRRMVLLK